MYVSQCSFLCTHIYVPDFGYTDVINSDENMICINRVFQLSGPLLRPVVTNSQLSAGCQFKDVSGQCLFAFYACLWL